ncbi:syntaxin-1A-like [Ostrinia nubilalis]|uniref:syntaxin-1A-like n=1 Tax=Ostrinia nubilalis TaxID=29057 RepID=UPI003082217A
MGCERRIGRPRPACAISAAYQCAIRSRRARTAIAPRPAMRSKDRLGELQQLANGGVYCATVEPAPPAAAAAAAAADVDDMFLEVERMRAWVHELNSNTQLVRRLHADPTYHTNRHLQDQMDSVITQSNGVGLKVCGALRQFEARVAGAAHSNDARARIARLQYACTRRLYADALHAHHAALRALRDSQLLLLHEQIKLTNMTISDEECESLLDSNNISLFVDNVKAETAEARRALRDVEARHEELARVEAALAGLRDLFLQLAHLVAAQQDQIDSVEYYALQATGHVELGGRELLKGTVSHARAKKKKLGLVICMVTGIAIVLLVLIAT